MELLLCLVKHFTLQRRHAQTIRDRSSSYNKDIFKVIKNFLNPRGHQHFISGSKVTAILLKEWILRIGGALAGEGLRLQPAQQPCFLESTFLDKVLSCK